MSETIEKKTPEPLDRRNGLKKEYATFTYNHFPFREALEPIQEPHYPEIDERRVLEMEQRVFGLFELLPIYEVLLQGELGQVIPEPYLRFRNATADLRKIVNEIWEYEKDQSTETNVDGAIDSTREEIGLAPKSTKKRLMRDFFIRKREYFESGLALLYILKGHPNADEVMKAVYSDFLDEMECIQLAHTCFMIVQSAIDRLNERGREPARRKSGKTITTHVYEVCIHEYNRYMSEIKECTDAKKRHELYEELKFATVRALLHDFLEDYGDYFNERQLMYKIIELFNFEFHNQITLDRKALKAKGFDMPEEILFVLRNWERIEKELIVMKKPEEDDPAYFGRQLEWLDSMESKLATLKTKIADRKHGLETLDTLSPIKQAYKVIETLGIVDTALEYLPHDPRLKGEIMMLIETAIKQADRLLASNNSELDRSYKKPDPTDETPIYIRLERAKAEYQTKKSDLI